MEIVIHWYSLWIAYISCVIGNKSREEYVGDLKILERHFQHSCGECETGIAL